MQKKRYEIDDRKPSVLPKFGTAVVAIGSLASAAAMAAPSITDFQNFSASPELTQDVSTSPEVEPAPAVESTLPSRQAAEAPTENEPGSIPSQAEIRALEDESAQQSSGPTAVQVAVSPRPTPSESLESAPEPSSSPTPSPSPSQAAARQELAPLDPAPSTGNVSSPTPSGSSGGTSDSWGTTGASSQSSGNVSSPTPSGSYDDDDHDDDHDDD